MKPFRPGPKVASSGRHKLLRSDLRLLDVGSLDLGPAHVAGDPTSASSGPRFDVEGPATGLVFASAPDLEVEGCLAALDACEEATPAWTALVPRARAEILRGTYERMVRLVEPLARLISCENGEPMADSRAEVLYAAEFFRWYAEETVRAWGELGRAPGGGGRILVQHAPVGTCLLLTPWNFPFAMPARKLAPALAAGCACVLKPAVETPLAALALAAILRDAGLPPGVVGIATTSWPESVVAALLADRRTRKLSFTGSTEVGRTLARIAADRVVNCSLELGGNAPFIVFADADLDRALDAAMVAKMRNGGQACTAANRFYVERPCAAEFAERFARRMAALRMGPASDPLTEHGPLVSARGRAGVEAAVAMGVADGATIFAGGRTPEGHGHFYPPTVLADVPATSGLLASEVFGPVAPVTAFEDEEVVTLANATEAGLTAYVHTSDLGRGLRVADCIRLA